ncbi:MAG: RNA-binding domain-containing protein [Candidatus Bathyarchaeia archaeon]
MKLPVAYIDIRFSAHATEDVEKVKKALCSMFPQDLAEEISFKEGVVKGHYGNPITLFEARIKDQNLLKAFVEKLAVGLNGLDKETLLKEWKLFVEKSNLYLRLDKQAAFEGEFRLHQADPIHIRVHFTKKYEENLMEVCRELGLVL